MRFRENIARRDLALRAHWDALSIVAVDTSGQTLRATRSPELGSSSEGTVFLGPGQEAQILPTVYTYKGALGPIKHREPAHCA